MKKLIVSLIGLFVFQTVLFAQTTITPISAIQGDTFRSPLVNKKVTTQGIVTGIRRDGFFIQTPDGKQDQNPKSSEGLLIFTKDDPPRNLKIGQGVEVSGTVAEFRLNRDRYALFTTEIVNPKVKVISSDNPLPKPILIDTSKLKPTGNVDQLEPFEGMRVRVAELEVVAPTGGREDRDEDRVISSGDFFGVLKGTPRPFREPGLDALTVLFDRIKGIPVFDMNPEILRIDSNGLNDAKAIDVSSGSTIRDLVGILDYRYKKYTILLEPGSNRESTGGMVMVPTAASKANELTIASFNVENLFDDKDNSDIRGREFIVSSEHFEKRLKKISLSFKEAIRYPDIVGIIEVENKKVLEKLKDRINEDLKKDGRTDVVYEAFLEESNDVRGIDVGFLMNSKKVEVKKVEQIAASERMKHKDSHPKETLFSRPPFLAEISAKRKDGTTYDATVIVNHFKSYRGIDDVRSGDRVRNKKRKQAERLAKEVAARLASNPSEKIFVLGDFNSFQFHDGYNDLIGTLKGKPFKAVIAPASTVSATGLVNLVDYIQKGNRYSYVFDGSAQVLDHILVNRNATGDVRKFGFARFNVDFPRVLADDVSRPERVSDHDVPVAFIQFDK